MKRLLLITSFLLLLSSCDRDCEAFDMSLEIAQWHLFPEQLEAYSYASESNTIVLEEIRTIISPFETIRCSRDCSCHRKYVATYGEGNYRFQSIVSYIQDEEAYFPMINYEIGYMGIEFDIDPSGALTGLDEDSIPFTPYIDYEIHESLSLGDSLYQKVLHISVPQSVEVTDMWVARGAGMVAFREDSMMYVRK